MINPYKTKDQRNLLKITRHVVLFNSKVGLLKKLVAYVVSDLHQ